MVLFCRIIKLTETYMDITLMQVNLLRHQDLLPSPARGLFLSSQIVTPSQAHIYKIIFILFSFEYFNDNNLIRCTIARTDKNVQITILIPIFFFFYLPRPLYRKQAPDVWRSLLSNCIALIFLNLPSSCSVPQPLPWQ